MHWPIDGIRLCAKSCSVPSLNGPYLSMKTYIGASAILLAPFNFMLVERCQLVEEERASFFTWCLVAVVVLWLFLTVPRVCLQWVIVVLSKTQF